MAEDSKLFAFLGIFLTWVGYIIVRLTKQDDEYAMYYAKQGLVLGIAWVAIWFIGFFLGMFLKFIPIFGGIISFLISFGLSGIMLIFWIVGIIFSLSGEMKPVPIIGQIASKF